MNTKKLSVVFVTNNYIPYQGGVVSSILATRDGLRKNGHTVNIITLDYTGNHAHEDGVLRMNCPVRFIYKKNHMALPLFPHLNLDRLFKQLKPDIVHMHHPFLLGQAALLTAKKNKIPTVFTYHTLYEYYLHYVPLPKQILHHALQKRVRSFCNTVDGIIAPGTVVEERIREYAPEKTVRIIPSSIAPIFFEPSQTPSKNPHMPLTLLTVSRFTHEKNITFLLDVMKLLEKNSLRLILAGYGSAYTYLRNYAYCIKNLSPNQVIFIEKPSKEQLLQLYKQAHLFLFASTSDTQGLVLAEAMSQGTPVIALYGPGQKDIIKNGINGFLVQTSEEMAKKIVATLSNHQLLRDLQKNALKTAQNYTNDYLIESLTDFYQFLIKQ